jgi:hypothetical protein
MYQFDKYIKQNKWLRHRFNRFITYLTKLKHVNVINLIGSFDQIDVGIAMVPIENNIGPMANIKSSCSSNIPKWKS